MKTVNDARLRGMLWVVVLTAAPLEAQVQIRLGDSTRVTYSEIHERLMPGTPAADSVLRILRETRPGRLWPIAHQMLKGKVDWNTGVLALTRIAELRDPASRDSVHRWRERISNDQIPPLPATDLRDLFPVLRAIQLELDRKQKGDQFVLNDFLSRIPDEQYDLGDAWVFGRLGEGAPDSVARRFLETPNRNLRIRYLTLLSFSRDTTLIPLLTRVYVAPDSFDLPVRVAIRASDGLLWIGTRNAVTGLLDARSRARERGIYADPRLGHAGLDFLGNDSSMVVSRTGRWLTAWLNELQ